MLTPFFHFSKMIGMNKHIALGIDSDGVLAQFDERVLELTGVTPNVLDGQGALWSTLVKYPTFFRDLAPYREMVDLYHEIKNKVGYVRVITGRPRKDGFPAASDHKREWVKEHLDANLDVIVCLSRDKQKYISKSHDIDILIDDRVDNINRWIKAGGVGILHTSAATTRETLLNLLNL